jgi:hypothetical protein
MRSVPAPALTGVAAPAGAAWLRKAGRSVAASKPRDCRGFEEALSARPMHRGKQRLDRRSGFVASIPSIPDMIGHD